MEITRKKPKIHKVEKSSDQVLENKEALKSDQRSIPEAITPLAEGKKSSQGIKKSRDKVKATKTAMLGDQRSRPVANTLETESNLQKNDKIGKAGKLCKQCQRHN